MESVGGKLKMKPAKQAVWKRVRVGDTLRLVNGMAFKPTDWSKDGLPIVRIQNLNNPEASFNQTTRNVPEKFKLRGGELLFAWSGTPGTSFGAHIWRGGEALLNQHIFNIIFNENEWDKRFLQFAINQNLAGYIRAAHGGAGLAHITKGRFEESELLQPTHTEQRRIVAEIEEQFARLEVGVAALRRVAVKLKRYRAAVLKAACEGHLVPTEAELCDSAVSPFESGPTAKASPAKEGSLASAKTKPQNVTSNFESGGQLLARILIERRQNWLCRGKYKEPTVIDGANLPPLPLGWTWASMRQVGEVQLGRQRAPQHHYGDNMRPYLRVANVFEARIDTNDVKEMNFTPVEYERYHLRYGDILLNEGQTPELVGRPAMFRNEVADCCYQKTLLRFRAYEGVLPQYALTVFRAYLHNQRFTRAASITTNIAHLTAEKFVEIEFPLPPFAEQVRIVEEVERRLSVVENLLAVVTTNLQRATSLRQSILQKAFLEQP